MEFKLFVFILMFFLYSLFIKAQEFGGGVIGGLSSSQLSGDQLSGFDKAGILFGVFTNRIFSEKINGKMELVYIQKGSKNPNQDQRHEFYLNYIEVPLLLQYKAQNNMKLEAGFQLGFLLDEKEKDTFGAEHELRDNFKKTDWNVCIGLDYRFTEKISLNSRLSNTLIVSPIRNHASSAKKWYNQGQYNSVLSFAINYHF